MSEFVEVPFYGDALQAVREGERVSVVIKRVCEALGVAPQGQLEKLKNKPWAVVTMNVATGPDGKSYEVACLDLDALPMWLATIEPSRVAESARPKLAAYQTECARVLRDHFFGRRQAQHLPIDLEQLVERVVVRCVEAVVKPLSDALSTLSKTVAEAATIAPHDAAWLKRQVREIASLQVAAGLVKGKTPKHAANAARRRIYNKLGQAVGWTGTGRSWDSLPAARFPEARALLIELRRDLPPPAAAPAVQLSLIDGGKG